MRKIVILTIVLLLSGCRKVEQDWLIGRWFVVECSYINEKTGESGDCDPGFDIWEFTDTGRLIIDGGTVSSYSHNETEIIIGNTVYDIASHTKEKMKLEHRSLNGITFYSFTR